MRLIRTLVLLIGPLLPFTASQAEVVLAMSRSLTDKPAVTPVTTPTTGPLSLTSEQHLAKQDIWSRMRTGFSMRDLDSPLVKKHEQWYASHPDYMARMTERARRYLYYITLEVERRGMPSEIALLPMIESAFNPIANSPARASGIWQFIPSTGRNFGMEQNWWYDGRRDIISATNGALDYLDKLHDMFGDWELALAAYNWGERGVQRSQERNRHYGLPVNYGSLRMPTETRNYIPKLLALRNVIANPASYGLVLANIPNQPYFGAISTAKHIDLKLAAQLADVSEDEFMALNPGHNRPVMLQGDNDLILLPYSKVETFRTNLESYNKPLVNWQSYQPKNGERLDQLAPRFGLSVERLKSINGLDKRKVSTSQTLLVPVNGEVSEHEATRFSVFNMNLPSNTARSASKKAHKSAHKGKRRHVASR